MLQVVVVVVVVVVTVVVVVVHVLLCFYLNQKMELELQFVLWSQRTVVADLYFRCGGVVVLTKPLDVQASIFGACLKPG